MKAVTCKEHGLPDKLELVSDWPEPEVGEHDISRLCFDLGTVRDLESGAELPGQEQGL